VNSPYVYISTPCYTGKVDINYHTSMLMTMKYLGENRIQHMFNYAVNTGVDAARSKHATELLQTNCTHLMMIDDDMAWAPDLVARMLEEDLDIIGVPYRRKIVTPVSFTARHTFEVEHKKTRPYLVKVDGISCGMTLVKRRVFEALKDKMPVIRHDKDGPDIIMFFRHELIDDKYLGTKTYMSEDYNFCRLAREAGFDIWAYVDEEVAHMGTVAYRGKLSESMAGDTGSNLKDERLKMHVRLVGETMPQQVVDFPVECEVDGQKKILMSRCKIIDGGVLLPNSEFKDPNNPDVKAYLAKIKALYHTEETQDGLKVLSPQEKSS